MKRKYPAKMFLLFVLTNFLFRFFYLFIPGTVLCVVGIWSQTYLYVGLAVLGLDLILSIVEQGGFETRPWGKARTQTSTK